MNSYGTVQTHVFASRANLPLAGVSVSVRGSGEPDGGDLLSLQQTDRQGSTVPIPISTPDAAESRFPGGAAGFRYLDIIAELPGYEQVIVRNVQVFPGIGTLQEIQMVPLDLLSPEAGTVQEFVISPQNL